ncbi:MAG: polysaccharide deacetylase family protein [Eubacteriales bacterium]|nr:polysaccharide deacetylase family protein [Eubacteriales bacterium]
MKCKRILSLCLCSSLLLFSLAGCGAGTGESTKASADTAPQSSTASAGSAQQPAGSAAAVPDADKPAPAPQPEKPSSETPAETPQNTLPQGDKYMAITFDDGPTGNEGGRTERLLDGLKARGVHATFFLCGYRVKDFNSMMDRYLVEGHEVGNHTMDHIRLDTKTDDGGYAQVSATNDLIASYTGQKPTLIRPTGGAYNDAVISSMRQLGLPIILWNIDTLDWKDHDNAALIKQRIVENAQDGAIVLEHDLYEATVEGVLAAIDELQAQGYAFVTVSELAQLKGVTLEPGKVYSGFTANDTVVESGANYS